MTASGSRPISGGYVDPSGLGYCRYVANGDSNEVFIPIATTDEWLDFRYGPQSHSAPPGVTETVCCRPSPTPVTLCAGATGGTVQTSMVSDDSSGHGYQTLNGLAHATATCLNPPYGDYVETQTFQCQLDPTKPSSGPYADGAWSSEVGDTDNCQANSYTAYGGCSVSCGGGNLYETVYNSCGHVTSQGYNGPTCNMQSCCTPSYSYGCSGSSYMRTDNTCGGGTVQVGSCHLAATSGTSGCDLGYGDSYQCGTGTIDYYQCNAPWYCKAGNCSGTCTPNPPAGSFDAIVTGNCAPGKTSPVNSASCSGSYWAP